MKAFTHFVHFHTPRVQKDKYLLIQRGTPHFHANLAHK